MAYRNKTYIAFDGDEDMHYYRLMTAWSRNDDFEFEFSDAHDLNTARDSSQEESIKKQLRERFANSNLFIVLIGAKTRHLTKFVQWEIETAIRLKLPIIGINLNGSRKIDDRCPSSLKDALAVYVPFAEKIIVYAMKNWPANDARFRQEGKTGPFIYVDNTYNEIGLNK
jgi:hypothetical protein